MTFACLFILVIPNPILITQGLVAGWRARGASQKALWPCRNWAGTDPPHCWLASVGSEGEQAGDASLGGHRERFWSRWSQLTVWEVDPPVGKRRNCRYIWDMQDSCEPAMFSSGTTSLKLSGKVQNVSWAGVML